jgi:DNA gyrase subunit A
VLSAFSNPRKGGINAASIREGDDLIEARITDGSQEIILGTRDGKAIRFLESDVREMGRQASGVGGIHLMKNDSVVGMVTVRSDSTLLVVTEKGYGKRTKISEYRMTRRGGKGIVTVNTNDKVGKMVTIKEVFDDDDLMIISTKGKVIRQSIEAIRKMGRATQGIRLIKLGKEDKIADIARIVKENDQ